MAWLVMATTPTLLLLLLGLEQLETRVLDRRGPTSTTNGVLGRS